MSSPVTFEDKGESVVVAHPMRRQIGALTGLRFFAALYVFIFHFGAGFADRAGAPKLLSNFLHNGYLGVCVFFVLSGFILAYTYRDGVPSLKLFFQARFARIYPVYLLALIVALPFEYKNLTFPKILSVLTMTQSWAAEGSGYGFTWVMQAWTLSVEFFFYLCFPVVIYFVNKISKQMLFFFVAVFAILILLIGTPALSPGNPRPDLSDWILSIPLPILRLPEFIFGVLIGKLFGSHSSNKSTKSSARSLNWSVLILLVLIIVNLALVSHAETIGSIGVFVGILIYLLASSNGLVSKFLSLPLVALLGGASYAMYMLQGPIRQWVGSIISAHGMAEIVNPVVWIILSCLVFVWWEQPVRKFLLRKRSV